MGGMPSSLTDLPRPMIGLTTYLTRAVWGVWDQPATLLPHAYVESVAAAGGLPVLLPVLPGVIEPALSRLDGLLVTGGPDLDPAWYGAVPGEHTQPASRCRDTAESELLAGAISRGLPVLGICRGAQVLNVVRGGTLIQHLPDVVGSNLHCPAPGRHARHDVRLAPDSRLAAVLSGPDGEMPGWISVPTYHHQGVDQLGAGLVPTAWAQDGTIEAVEDPALPFCVGVQWHPEVGEDLSLFEALVAVAARRGQPAGASA